MFNFRTAVSSIMLLASLTAFAKTNGKVVVGFAQIGAESAWRIANTKSIKESVAKAGYVLNFVDAQQKQANQIKALKSFILQKVDVIVLAPVVESGWHDVLTQAKKANIPVILIDRMVDEKDTSLYAASFGSDFLEEGKRAGKCMIDSLKKVGMNGQVNLLELRGTEGSAPAVLRKKGFEEVIASASNIKIVRSENGDFKEGLGKELTEKVLKEEAAKGVKINAIYAHNDNMALGAIPAVEAAGLKPGKDVTIVSVDAIKNAFVAMKDGKLNCTVECSPLLGDQLVKVIGEIIEGKTIPKRITTNESVYPADTAAKELPNRTY